MTIPTFTIHREFCSPSSYLKVAIYAETIKKIHLLIGDWLANCCRGRLSSSQFDMNAHQG